MRALHLTLGLAIGLMATTTSLVGQNRLTVVETRPAGRALSVSTHSRIEVRFDRPIFGASVTPATFWAFGRWSGPVRGRIEESFDGLSIALVPDRPFSAGEQVTVFLSRDLTAGDGTNLRSAGYSFQFWTRSLGTGFDFVRTARRTTRDSPAVSTRSYGGLGSDLDGDGFLDLTVINEDTNDLRVFLNRADRSGRVRRYLRPAAGVGSVPSPSEPSDFDRDGRVDIAVANTQDRTVSILLGRGDGTFAEAQHYPVGEQPRGLAVLDADGDGDVDVAATSFVEGRVTVLLNDGAGRFEESSSFGSGGGERALAAGDLDGDGILDLVVGDLVAGEVRVYAGSGDARFDLVDTRSAGGPIWMLVLGDVDGDGDEDVATVNSEANNGAILLGDGRGGLTDARMTATQDFPLATDLADLDGDGDLDWMTSSFFGDWQLFENDGGGTFREARVFPAARAASCSIPMDLDGDGVLDLALIDELADEVVLLENRSLLFSSNFESGATDDWTRTRGAVAVVSPGLRGTGHALEVALGDDPAPAFVEARWPHPAESLAMDFTLDASRLDLSGAIEILRLGSGSGEVVVRIEPFRNRLRIVAAARQERGRRRLADLNLRPRVPVRLRLEWQSATPGRRNGSVALLRRGGRFFTRSLKIPNQGGAIARLRLGLPRGADGRGVGSFFVDEITIER